MKPEETRQQLLLKGSGTISPELMQELDKFCKAPKPKPEPQPLSFFTKAAIALAVFALFSLIGALT